MGSDQSVFRKKKKSSFLVTGTIKARMIYQIIVRENGSEIKGGIVIVKMELFKPILPKVMESISSL